MEKNKSASSEPGLDVFSLFFYDLKVGVNDTQNSNNPISRAEMIKQLRRIKRIDTFFCCCCLFNATTGREEVLPQLSRDCVQLPNKQLNGREPKVVILKPVLLTGIIMGIGSC